MVRGGDLQLYVVLKYAFYGYYCSRSRIHYYGAHAPIIHYVFYDRTSPDKNPL